MNCIHLNLKSVIVILFTFVSLVAILSSYSEIENAMWISGKVIWKGHDLTGTSVEVFKDPKFKALYTSGLLFDPDGVYALTISDPGTYYMVAFVDYNKNDIFDAGDGIGMYGVTDWADPNQKIIPIELEKGSKLSGIDIQIAAIADAQGRMRPLSSDGSEVGTGVSGRLIWPISSAAKKQDEDRFSKAIVFAYSDPSWSNRIAQTKVDKDGNYQLSIPAGRYYLLAVIDENNTNLLDSGDKFGIWGMTRFGMFPKAVKVDDGNITMDRNILIVGYINFSGKPTPLQDAYKEAPASDAAKKQLEKMATLENKIVLSGYVVWPDHEVKSGTVQAYSDPSMTVVEAQAKTDENGHFRLAVPSGDYYIVAGVDLDKNGRYSEGDGIGAYGVTNAAEGMPEKYTVTEGSQKDEISLVITAEFDGSGQLRPILNTDKTEKDTQHPASSIQHPVSSIQYTGISGKIVWEGCEISNAILIFSNEPKFEGGTRVPLQLAEEGSYNCSVPPGAYYIMAVVDRNGDEQLDPGDGMGFYGAGYWDEPQKVTVFENKITTYINISIDSVFDPDGEVLSIQSPGSIRLRYGEPDKVTTDSDADVEIQEWWYWNKGLSFTFNKTDYGWNLVDTSEFPSMGDTSSEVTESADSKRNPNGTIYYVFDRNIWAEDADGANRRWIAPGTHLTADLEGNKLLFLDTSGNVYLARPWDETPPQLVISREEVGLQPAISHSGEALAFVREAGDHRRIILKKLGTGEENPIPVAADVDQYNPAWSSDDELIAYSASMFSSGQPNQNRDIYYYDLVSGRTERISTNPQDEFDPVWSPVDKKVLVYCRSEGEYDQLWIATIGADGRPEEHQLTRYGGRNPAWSPKGDRIIYENNAQIWTIDPDGSNEQPIILNNEPVFGLDPSWTR